MNTHGFNLVREEEIAELSCVARLYLHGPTGAELLSILCDDENKAFGITFRTPPEDSTGVAHILEHSVLCGSRKYPLKEPFVELLKGSSPRPDSPVRVRVVADALRPDLVPAEVALGRRPHGVVGLLVDGRLGIEDVRHLRRVGGLGHAPAHRR